MGTEQTGRMVEQSSTAGGGSRADGPLLAETEHRRCVTLGCGLFGSRIDFPFCNQCGEPTAGPARCIGCGRQVYEHWRHCGYCGQLLHEPEAL